MGSCSFFVLSSDFHRNIQALENLEQKFIFQLGTFNPHVIDERLSSTNTFMFQRYPVSTRLRVVSNFGEK